MLDIATFTTILITLVDGVYWPTPGNTISGSPQDTCTSPVYRCILQPWLFGGCNATRWDGVALSPQPFATFILSNGVCHPLLECPREAALVCFVDVC
jgi:hypothetical protein